MQEKKYSQLTAMLAIARASFRSITRSPSAVVFTLLFPLIFILVFGFLSGGSMRLDIGVEEGSDKNNPVYEALRGISEITLAEDKSEKELFSALEKGRLDAVMNISLNEDSVYIIELKTTAASIDKGNVLRMIMDNLVTKINLKNIPEQKPLAEIRQAEIHGREYKTIDFILPGQLGFSILSSGVFGTAFVFFNLRQTLVIKRFFATPIRKPFIILGEALSRIVFALLGALFIISIGHFAFGFTLVKGWITLFQMLLLSALGLMVFMGFGFVVSGVAKSESTIPPLANIITLPQFLLSGTFFSIEAFPQWLQPVCKSLPLTYINDALRKIAFEGAGMSAISMHLLIIVAWGIGVYVLAVRFFRWE